jgi:hypothetical protein
VNLVRSGDRFRTQRPVASHIQLGQYAPSHTAGVKTVVPEGTVLVALDQVEHAPAFACYPEEYERMEKVLIPEKDREHFWYAGTYSLVFQAADIGDLLEPLPPHDPRPANRLPRVPGRPSPLQQEELDAWGAVSRAVQGGSAHVTRQVADGAWVRWRPEEGPRLSVGDTPLHAWDIWFDQPPGEAPREPDLVLRPGSPMMVTGRIHEHLRRP